MDPVLLRPGFNIESWAEVKYSRAEELWGQFNARVASWEATIPLRTKVIQVGPSEAWLVLDVQSQPPFAGLAVSLGDMLHNLRASLDAAVWSMATFDGADPPKPRKVQMPVFDAESDFDQWLGTVKLPRPEFEDRLRQLQPFARAEDLKRKGQSDVLVALHDLDIVDKHRAAVPAAVALAAFDGGGLHLKGIRGLLSAEPATDVPLRDGARILTIRASKPFEVVDPESGVAAAVFSIPFDDGYARTLDFSRQVFGFVRKCLQTIYGEFDVIDELADFEVRVDEGAARIHEREVNPDGAI